MQMLREMELSPLRPLGSLRNQMKLIDWIKYVLLSSWSSLIDFCVVDEEI